MTTNTHPLDASADAARAALIRIGEARAEHDRRESAEVAPIVKALTPAQRRVLVEETTHGHLLGQAATMRALERHGLVRHLAQTGVGSNVWAEFTPLGGKVYRALRRSN